MDNILNVIVVIIVAFFSSLITLIIERGKNSNKNPKYLRLIHLDREENLQKICSKINIKEELSKIEFLKEVIIIEEFFQISKKNDSKIEGFYEEKLVKKMRKWIETNNIAILVVTTLPRKDIEGKVKKDGSYYWNHAEDPLQHYKKRSSESPNHSRAVGLLEIC